MRRIGMAIAALAVALTAADGRAGVYALDDPAPRYPVLGTTWEEIKLALDPMRLATVPVLPQLSPAGYKQLAAELEAKAPDQRTTLDRLKLGVCNIRLGRYGDAVRILRDAEWALKPDDSNAYLLKLVLREAELEGKGPATLTNDDRINLGACYIRLGRFNDAVTALRAADQNNFLVLADLAAAQQGAGELQQAVDAEDQALRNWPSFQPGWNDAELYWFHRAETAYLKLLRLRLRETIPPVKRRDAMDALFESPPPEAVDLELGPDVLGLLASPTGQGPLLAAPSFFRPPARFYGPVMQPWKVWAGAPPDAYQIVAQLLVWSPNDDRLYWQLGELLNSMGSAREAYKVLDELVNTRSGGTWPELQNHRKVLKGSLDVVDAVNTLKADPIKFQADLYTLMWQVSPRGMLPPSAGGDLADEAALAAQQPQPQPPAPPPPPSPAQLSPLAPNPSGGVWPDWRPMLVGFAAGLIVATLAALQWIEWRRRRQAAAVPAGAPPPPPPEVLPQRTEPAVHDAGAIRTNAPTAPDRMEGAP